MDKVICAILVLILAFMLQYLWQVYKTSDGIVVGVDVAEAISGSRGRDEPQNLPV